MKKRIAAIVVILGVAALLTACGEKKQQESQQQAGQASQSAQPSDSQNAGDGGDNAQQMEPVPDAQPVEEPTYDEINQNGDENPAEEQGDEEERWNGTFTSASGETLTISGADGSSLSFAFAQCGISGSAQKDENSGSYIYHGDDSAVVLFSLSGDTVDVNVTSEEDYDMSESPMIGSYGRT